jgi:hypothetical protein
LLYTGFGQGREEKTIAGDDNKTVCWKLCIYILMNI